MKALSLWQPWATLIATGAKRFETRSWSTPYRGLLVIHAAKSTKGMEVCEDWPFDRVLLNAGYESGKQALPMGCALCVVHLVGIYRTEDIRQKMRDYDDDPQSNFTRYEHYFGDYSPGRFAWQLEIAEVFPEPIPMKGAQGLFDAEIAHRQPIQTAPPPPEPKQLTLI